MSARRRLDAELVRRGLAPSREQAQRDIAAGRVLVGGAPASKPARLVHPGEALVVQGPGPRFVSRAGAKLEGALERFEVDVTGWRVLDAGASTGGFTDCLLQRGVAEVIAVDVGYGQLHERVARDPRVVVIDRTNVRAIDVDLVGTPVDLVTADLSFISLRTVLDALLGVLRTDGEVVTLVKPQFEAGREAVARGKGIVSDPTVWRAVLDEVLSAFEERGAAIMGVMVSPITGTDGNVEFLAHARRGATPSGSVAQMIDAAVVAATPPGGTDSVPPAADPVPPGESSR